MRSVRFSRIHWHVASVSMRLLSMFGWKEKSKLPRVCGR
jgi:hypothetical protein